MKNSTLVVGVTGRRHIVPDASARVETAIRALLARLDNLDVAEIVVETGLAIGADSLVARAVLERRARDPRSILRLRAVLPMPVEEYALDFKTSVDPASGRSERDEFYALLGKCDDVVELPIAARRPDGSFSRSDQYAALGARLVERSEILAAFFNGRFDVVKPGGTVDVALRKLRAIERGDGALLFVVQTPEVLRVVAPDGTKTRVPEPSDASGTCATLARVGESPRFESVEAALDRLGAFFARRG